MRFYLGGQGQGLVALGKFVKKSRFLCVRPYRYLSMFRAGSLFRGPPGFLDPDFSKMFHLNSRSAGCSLVWDAVRPSQ